MNESLFLYVVMGLVNLWINEEKGLLKLVKTLTLTLYRVMYCLGRQEC